MPDFLWNIEPSQTYYSGTQEPHPQSPDAGDMPNMTQRFEPCEDIQSIKQKFFRYSTSFLKM